MAETVYSLTYTRPQPDDAIKIEQVPWDDLQEQKPPFPEWLKEQYGLIAGNLIDNNQWDIYYRYQDEWLGFCSAEDGSFQAQIRVYRQAGKRYIPAISHGTMSAPFVHNETYSEPVTIRNDNKLELSGAKIQAAGFDEQPRDERGIVINPQPEAIISENKISYNRAIALGVARVELKREYDTYLVNIPPRADDPNHAPGFSINPGGVSHGFSADVVASDLFTEADRYRSKFMVFWEDISGKFHSVDMDIEPPDMENDPNSGTRSPPPEEPPPEEKRPRLVIPMPYNYCSGEPIEGATIIIDGATVPDDEAIEIQPGTHSIVTIGDNIQPTNEDSLTQNDNFEFSVEEDMEEAE